MKKFNEFISESLIDKMTPKSEEEINSTLDKLGLHELLNTALYTLHDLNLVKKVLDDKSYDPSSNNNKILKDFTLAWHYDEEILNILDNWTGSEDGIIKNAPDFTEEWFIGHCLDNTQKEQKEIMDFYKEVLKLFLTDRRVSEKLSAIEILGYRTLLGLK